MGPVTRGSRQRRLHSRITALADWVAGNVELVPQTEQAKPTGTGGPSSEGPTKWKNLVREAINQYQSGDMKSDLDEMIPRITETIEDKWGSEYVGTFREGVQASLHDSKTLSLLCEPLEERDWDDDTVPELTVWEHVSAWNENMTELTIWFMLDEVNDSDTGQPVVVRLLMASFQPDLETNKWSYTLSGSPLHNNQAGGSTGGSNSDSGPS